GDFSKFEATAIDALERGASVQILVKHHHAIASGLHTVTLSVSKETFSFDPQSPEKAPCTYKAFTSPVTAIVHADVNRTAGNELYLNVKVADAKDPKRILNLNFTDSQSHFIQAEKSGGGVISYTGHQLVSRPQAAQALNSVANILKRIAPNSH